MQVSIWIQQTAIHLIDYLRNDVVIDEVNRCGKEFRITFFTQEYVAIVKHYGTAPGVTSIFLRP